MQDDVTGVKSPQSATADREPETVIAVGLRSKGVIQHVACFEKNLTEVNISDMGN